MKDPLGFNSKSTKKQDKPDSLQQQLSQSKNRAKEFERKLIEQEEQIIGIKKDSIDQRQQQNFEAPRKLFFKTNQKEDKPQDINIKEIGLSETLYGEILLKKVMCQMLLTQSEWFEGDFAITNYKVEYIITKGKVKQNRKDALSIPLQFLYKIERNIEKKQQEIQIIDIYSKDGRFLKLKFLKSQNQDSMDIFSILQKTVFSDFKDTLFAFAHYQPEFEKKWNGWNIYNVEEEFERQGVQIAPENQQQETNGMMLNSLFKYFTNTNTCSTYPDKLVIRDSYLIMQNRLYRGLLAMILFKDVPSLDQGKDYQFQVMPFNHKIQQYHYGDLLNARQVQGRIEIKKMKIISNISPISQLILICLVQEKPVQIYDARPFLNAMGQRITGKGYENTDYYRNCQIDFLDIHNIHKVSDAFKKIQSGVLNDANMLFSQLDQAGWYEHLVSLVQGAIRVVQTLIREKKNVLVHCSDGWDRTASLISLAQIMIDPYFRTMKEWVYAGHQFATRSGLSSRSEHERSPIFIQFLDSVYQLTQMYPLSFEFNTKFLLKIAYHYHSALYGTFICDSYQELKRFNVMEKTISLWSKILSEKERYFNCYYKQPSEIGKDRIIPQFSGKQITVWKEYFYYYLFDICDYYQILPDVEFNNDNVLELFKEQQKRNEMLRQEQIEQEQQLQNQEEQIKQLKNQIIQAGKEHLLT